MKLNFLPSPRIAALAVAALSLSGCSNEINLIVDPDLGKVVLNPQKGQTINWKTDDPAFAQFLVSSPCSTSQGLNTKTCTVSANSGIFLYQCDHGACQDPEVVVGSDPGSIMTATVHTFAGPIAGEIALGCQNNAVVALPNPAVTSAGQPYAVGQTVKFIAVGETPITGWSTSFATTICSTAVSQGQPYCTIANGTQPNAQGYPFTVSASNCGNGSGKIATQ